MYESTHNSEIPPGATPPNDDFPLGTTDDDADSRSYDGSFDDTTINNKTDPIPANRRLDVSRLDNIGEHDQIQDIGLDDDIDEHNQQYLKQTHEGEHRGDQGEFEVPISKSVYVFAACAALNSCNLGYDVGVNTDAAKLVQDSLSLTDVQLEIFMGSLNLFAMVGALGAQYITDRFGRKKSFIIAAVFFIIGVILMASAGTFVQLMFGRVFVGLGVGFGLAVDPIYIAEISPASHRGRLVTWSEIATNVGIVLGFLSGLIFSFLSPDMAWRWMFAMGGVMPVILIFLVLIVMPESPRWLVQNCREVEAQRVLERIYPSDFDVDMIIKDIRESIEKEIEAEHAVGWDVILFPTPAFRRMLICGIGIAIAQQAVGIDAIQYFLIFIIDETGIQSRTAQVVVLVSLGILKLIFIVIAAPMLDKWGRRPMFFISLGGCAVALFLISFDFFIESHNSSFAVFSLALYLSFFSLGLGPGCWLIPSEVFSTTIRAKAMGVATFLNRVTATLMASTFLSTAHAMTWAGFFLLLSIVCLVVMLFVWIYLPETKGRSLEDMSLYFAEITGDQSILVLEESLNMRHQHEMVERGGGDDDDEPMYVEDNIAVRASGAHHHVGVNASGTMA